tara:strand:+ start:14309 stop:14926 length:618 start_codon:yes stop_codon:yes gene_type:complete
MTIIINSYRFGSQTLTFVDSATSTSSTITMPAGAAENDIAFLADFPDGGGPPDSIPTGFSAIASGRWDSVRLRTSYKILGAGEGGSTITGMNGATSNSKVLLVFRPGTAATVAVSTWGNEPTSGNPSQQTISASGQTPPLVAIGVSATTGTPAFSVETPSFSANVTSSHVKVGYTIYNSSPSDHTVDHADLGDNVFQTGYIRAVF